MPKLNDAIKIVMPDKSEEVGLVQATYDDDGILIFNPSWGYKFYGVLNDDLKAQGVKIEVVSCPDYLERYKLRDSKGVIL